MKIWTLIFTLSAGTACAATPADFLARYQGEATQSQAGFNASAQRGRAFFAQTRDVSDRLPACTSCHSESPVSAGKHAITGKVIAPLSPRANAERLSSERQVEKWFRRNCREVVGRECTAAEKADVVAYLIEGK